MTTETREPAMHRFRWEARRAIDQAGVTMPELLPVASLNARHEDGVIVLDSDGLEVGRVPLHRIAQVDPDALFAHLVDAAPALAERFELDPDLLAHLYRERVARVWEPDEGDLVWVTTMPARGAAQPINVAVPRWLVVPEWPESDYPGPVREEPTP